MDYGMPHAHDMPVELREAAHSVPAKSNALGVKGTGEAGTTAAIAAVMNAISTRSRTAPPTTWTCRRRPPRCGKRARSAMAK